MDKNLSIVLMNRVVFSNSRGSHVSRAGVKIIATWF